ncbi:MAG: retroviral-like aspartic protease family protein [Prevotellaceae bacterium]|jgi:predicted aspartyl protease|nr:retroviral-like aspartic protease family protein [Prevotellaceae bacterium]
MDRTYSFTQKSKLGVFREIITNVAVSLPQGNSEKLENYHKTTALWDTGATNCVITPKTVAALGLSPISMREVSHAGGTSVENVYLIDILLPNGIKVGGIDVTECSEQAGNFGVIIGMDVITFGDFALTNVGGISVFSFRYPSTKTVDYVAEKRNLNKT